MNSSIDAVILAGGEGTRLKSVVSDRPKPMALVKGRPFMEWLLLGLRKQGVERFVICTHHLNEIIIDHFGDGSVWDVEIVYSHELSPLGTGGAIALAAQKVKSNEMLALNGDSFCEFDLSKLIRFHQNQNALATIQLTQVENCGRYGSVQVDDKGQVEAFIEKSKGGGAGWINAGIYLIQTSALREAPANQKISMEYDFLPKWVGNGLYAIQQKGTFIDIGLPETYRQAETIFSWESLL
ncbi:MAG: nucleotidyltransferase family protein [Candidatus Hinthialibacter antarcticus]|nr:nucleotidyltransferase family protein [Candidatus Hinthialibacter antarcticus]